MTTTPQNARAVTAEISDLVAKSVSSVRAAYVKAETDREVAARTEVFTKAMEKSKSLAAEIKKIKPDSVTIQLSKDDQGREVQTPVESWSKDSLKKRDELVANAKKLDEAIQAYLEDAPADDPNKHPYKVLKELMDKLKG